jgi:hypothetical protein
MEPKEERESGGIWTTSLFILIFFVRSSRYELNKLPFFISSLFVCASLRGIFRWMQQTKTPAQPQSISLGTNPRCPLYRMMSSQYL